MARSARPSLTEHAFDALRTGPIPTLEVARRVLGLKGHPGAASAAVFTLLAGTTASRSTAPVSGALPTAHCHRDPLWTGRDSLWWTSRPRADPIRRVTGSQRSASSMSIKDTSSGSSALW